MKYKAGDKVRIVSERTQRMDSSGGMDHWLGKVMTVRAVIENYGLYRMKEDIEEGIIKGWFWCDSMIAGLASEPEKVTICPKCGNAQLEWDYRFCPICGNPVKENAPTGAATPHEVLTCKSCGHYIGSGDFGLCCDLKYDLCYADTEVCKQFEVKEKAPTEVVASDVGTQSNNQL